MNDVSWPIKIRPKEQRYRETLHLYEPTSICYNCRPKALVSTTYDYHKPAATPRLSVLHPMAPD